MHTHEQFMYRALFIAQKGLSAAMPNPSVGAVIVHKDTIIGEGSTSAFGGSHAEVNAINSVKNKELLKESTLYVTLEPCSHYGKTPPCADLIVKMQIPNVVIGCVDPYTEVAGKGIEKLKNAGVQVIVGVLEKECIASNQRFFTFIQKKRPYIILKWAASADGFIAPTEKNGQKPVWISNNYSRQLTHKWRSEEMAILVGTKTVLDDNPSLTTRDFVGKNPVRIYIDANHKIDTSFAITNSASKTICLCAEFPLKPVDQIIYKKIDFTDLPAEVNRICVEENIQSIIIEGGSHTLQQFIDAELWDEARVFKSDVILKDGIKAVELNNTVAVSQQKIQNNILTYYKNQNND
ncbi:bifunctional diaminohydroxyphosphoribosylaminopyrimidine deaminase/5-amino-6-(5-phosphoribosylamino)uracil reductase RibD [Flavobacterium sp. CBA20B-1]|uniref:bifunctional diaminohydroxyphosphoribosylaminopyrimidine deaminase/5-amino-6-(5-phosphoribosylamino)uracil reductase RibD n=1 Tax=unclassified Flavobacterium TaxID=196869 RepID=UPI002224AA44|nr:MULTISPECIES: bifunctional diaminohydroxyphosphoribosylaminopyrimidine deaminase/5-amino-6-(5-phosphoribosylamino)uracil reductase RibD [unclassified Flavobacterium]WCM43083.1 bifunctional diaminohydroxyphosphoribosylaminopyrimidine deaminase/5-amino-6-(5-phosphoribosylamino)uracil reductase RibD [Flavobacterium sp. CBA20B-1]